MALRQPIKQTPANYAYQPPRIDTGQAESRRRSDTLVVPVPLTTTADRSANRALMPVMESVVGGRG
jgi:hypothetical protein